MGKSKWKAKSHGGNWAIFEKGLEEYKRDMLETEWWNNIKPDSPSVQVLTRKQKRRAAIDECIKTMESSQKQKLAEKKENALANPKKVKKSPATPRDPSKKVKLAGKEENVAKNTQPTGKITSGSTTNLDKSALIEKVKTDGSSTPVENPKKQGKTPTKQQHNVKGETSKSEKDKQQHNVKGETSKSEKDNKITQKDLPKKVEQDKKIIKKDVKTVKESKKPDTGGVKLSDRADEVKTDKVEPMGNKTGENKPEKQDMKEIKKESKAPHERNLQQTSKDKLVQRPDKKKEAQNKTTPHIPSSQEHPSDKIHGNVSEKVPLSVEHTTQPPLKEITQFQQPSDDNKILPDLGKQSQLSKKESTQDSNISQITDTIKQEPQESKDAKRTNTESHIKPKETSGLEKKEKENTKGKPMTATPKLDDCKDIGKSDMPKVESAKKDNVETQNKEVDEKQHADTIPIIPSLKHEDKKKNTSDTKKERVSSDNKESVKNDPESKEKAAILPTKMEKKIEEPFPKIKFQPEKQAAGESQVKSPQIEEKQLGKNSKEPSTKLPESIIPVETVPSASTSANIMSEVVEEDTISQNLTTSQIEGHKPIQTVLDESKKDKRSVLDLKGHTPITDAKSATVVDISIKATVPAKCDDPHITTSKTIQIEDKLIFGKSEDKPSDIRVTDSDKQPMLNIKSSEDILNASKPSLDAKNKKTLKNDASIPTMPINTSSELINSALSGQLKVDATPRIDEVKESTDKIILPEFKQNISEPLVEKQDQIQSSEISDEKQAATKTPKEQQKLTLNEKRQRRKTKSGEKETPLKDNEMQKQPAKPQSNVIPKLPPKTLQGDKDVSKLPDKSRPEDKEAAKLPPNRQLPSKDVPKLARKSPQEKKIVKSPAPVQLVEKEVSKPPAEISPQEKEVQQFTEISQMQDKEMQKNSAKIHTKDKEIPKVPADNLSKENEQRNIPSDITRTTDEGQMTAGNISQDKDISKMSQISPTEEVPKLPAETSPKDKAPVSHEKPPSEVIEVNKSPTKTSSKDKEVIATKNPPQIQEVSKASVDISKEKAKLKIAAAITSQQTKMKTPPEIHKDKKVSNLSEEITSHRKEVPKLSEEITSYSKEVPKIPAQIISQEKGDTKLSTEITTPDKEEVKLPTEIPQDKKLPKLPTEIPSQNKEVPKLQAEITSQIKEVPKLPAEIPSQNKEVPKLPEEIPSQDIEITKLPEEILSQDTKMTKLPPEITSQDKKVPKMSTKILSEDKETSKLPAEIPSQDKFESKFSTSTAQGELPKVPPKIPLKGKKLPKPPIETISQSKKAPKVPPKTPLQGKEVPKLPVKTPLKSKESPKLPAGIPPQLKEKPKLQAKSSPQDKKVQGVAKQENKVLKPTAAESCPLDNKVATIPLETSSLDKTMPKLILETERQQKLPSNKSKVEVESRVKTEPVIAKSAKKQDSPLKREGDGERQNIRDKNAARTLPKVNQGKADSKPRISKQPPKGQAVKQGDKKLTESLPHQQIGLKSSASDNSSIKKDSKEKSLTQLPDAKMQDKNVQTEIKPISSGIKSDSNEPSADKSNETKIQQKGKRTRQRSKRDSESEKEIKPSVKDEDLKNLKETDKNLKSELDQKDANTESQDKSEKTKLFQAPQLDIDKGTEMPINANMFPGPGQDIPPPTMLSRQEVYETDKTNENEQAKIFEQIETTQQMGHRQPPQNIPGGPILRGVAFPPDVLAQPPPGLINEPPVRPMTERPPVISSQRFKPSGQGIMPGSSPTQLPFGAPMNQSAQALPPQYQQSHGATQYHQGPMTTKYQHDPNTTQYQQQQNTMPISFARGISPSTQFSPGQGLPSYFQPAQSGQQPFSPHTFGQRPSMGRPQQLPGSPGTPSSTLQQQTFLTQGENDDDVQVPSLFDSFM